MTMDEVQLRQDEIPRDRDIILYCSCPNEVSSARVALLLHRKGILRVRPLLGESMPGESAIIQWNCALPERQSE